MPTDLEPGWAKRKRSTYNIQSDGPEVKPLPGVVWLSDLLKVVDAKRQTGYNEDDLPAPFKAPKSFVDVPHHLLAKDGYPSSMNWLDLACQKSTGKKAKVQAPESHLKEESDVQPSGSLIALNVHPSESAFDRFSASNELTPERSMTEGVSSAQTDSITVPLHRKKSRSGKTRHPADAARTIAARHAVVSSECEKAKPGNPFYREYPRYNDPLLPTDDYDRTMEIISKLYHVIDHGHGQLVDMGTKKLICTYAFENLETMEDDKRNEHQGDVKTVMMATDIFRKMPMTTGRSDPSSGLTGATEISVETPSRLGHPKSTASGDSQALPFIPVQRQSPLGYKPSRHQMNDRSSADSPKLSTGISSSATACQNPELKERVRRSVVSGALITHPTPDGTDEPVDSSPLTSLPPSEIDDAEVPEQPKQSNICSKELNKKLHSILINNPTQPLPPTRESSPLTSLAPSEPEAVKGTCPKEQPKSQITTNGALIHGKMFCFGARAGYDPEVLFSPYIPRQGASLSLYKLFLSQLPIFGSNLGARFKAFADVAFETARRQLRILNAPSMAQTDKDEPLQEFDFAGNFAFTFHNFFNKPHTDNDKGDVYCVWYPMDSVSRQIVTTSEGFWLEGGWFLFPEYRLAFNFGGKYVVQISWSGKRSFHQTLPSKEKEVVGENGKKMHFTRLGCSSQLTSSMARAAAKLGNEEQYNVSSNCDREVLDCKDILEMEGRGWKK